MSLIKTVEQLEAALDNFDADAMASAMAVLIDLLGPQSALAIAKAMLSERDLYHPRPAERRRPAAFA